MRTPRKFPKMAAIVMSFMLAAAPLIAAIGGNAAHAKPDYTPPPDESPDYSGTFSWINVTPPQLLGDPDLKQWYSLDFDDEDHLYASAFQYVNIMEFDHGAIYKFSEDGLSSTSLTENLTNFGFVLGIDVDTNGNLYAAENSESPSDIAAINNNVTIYKLPAGSDTWENITSRRKRHENQLRDRHCRGRLRQCVCG